MSSSHKLLTLWERCSFPNIPAIPALTDLHVGAPSCSDNPFFLTDSLPEVEVMAGTLQGEVLPAAALHHKLFAGSFLAFVISGIHRFQHEKKKKIPNICARKYPW